MKERWYRQPLMSLDCDVKERVGDGEETILKSYLFFEWENFESVFVLQGRSQWRERESQ